MNTPALKEETMSYWECKAWEIALRKGWLDAPDYPERLARLAAKLRAEDKGT